MLRLRYFGPFAAFLDGKPVAFPTRACARLLAILGLEPGKAHLRESLARLAWPEAESGREASNLRTALSSIRAAVGHEVVVSDRETVRLDPASVDSDWTEVQRLQLRADRDPDAESREQTLRQLVAFGDEPVLDGWDAKWIRPLRAERIRGAERAVLDLTTMRLASGDFREARELARRAIRLRPRAEASVILAMRAAIGLGEPADATALFERHRARTECVSPELAALASSIPTGATALVPTQSETFAAIFEEGMEEDPEATVRFLLRNRQFWWRQRDLRRSQEILSTALGADLPDDLRMNALLVLGSLYYRTSDYAEAMHAFDAAREMPSLTAAESSVIDAMTALVFFDTRRFEEAQVLNRAVIDRLPPDDSYRWKIENNWFGIKLHLSRDAEARAGFADILERSSGGGGETRYVIGVTLTNMACLEASVANWKAAELRAEQAKAIFTARLDPMYASGPIAIHALARAASGDPGGAAELVTAPLEPVRAGARRWAQAVFDYVAEGMAHLGEGNATREILRVNSELRKSIGHFRSPAEEICARRTEALARTRLGRPIVPVKTGTGDDHAALATWIANLADGFI